MDSAALFVEGNCMPSIARVCAFVMLGLCATAASPQDFCQIMASVVEQAPNKFREFRGPRDEFGDYVSTFILPGAAHCYVAGDYLNFVCVWRGISDPNGAKADLARGIEQCYPRAKTRTQNMNRGTLYSIRANGVAFRIHGNQGKVFLSIAMDE